MFGDQLEKDADGYLKTENYVFTRVPGVYACGDVQDRRYRQAITAACSGGSNRLTIAPILDIAAGVDAGYARQYIVCSDKVAIVVRVELALEHSGIGNVPN